MAEAPRPWDIRNLADLILGSGDSSNPPPPSPIHQQDEVGEDVAIEAGDQVMSTVLLVSPEVNATEAVGRYADYWSNRGQSVAVAWIGDSGIKIGLFDYLRRVVWATEIVEALEARRFEELPELIAASVRRVVVVIATNTGWEFSPFIQGCRSVSVLVEPSPQQLISAYGALKYVAQFDPPCQLRCFVAEALSARQATELSARLQQMGSRFLSREIDFEGFSLCEQWPSSNLVAETFISEDGKSSVAALRCVLLEYVNPEIAELEMQTTASTNSSDPPPGPIACDDIGSEPQTVLPTVKPISVPHTVQNSAQLDQLIGEVIEEICGAVVETYPIHSSPESGYRLRWVFRKNGGRVIVACAIEQSLGALEQAAAHLYPARDDDEIIVLARCVPTEHRKAAAGMSTAARLYEVSQMPPESPPMLLLKEVTDLVA